jgi:hypothetical protein
MEPGNYSPRLTFIILIALIIGQVFIFNYLKNDFDKQITACYEAINTSSIIQGALVNVLVKRNIINRDELMKEAGNLSTNLQAMMEKMKDAKTPDKGLVKDDKEQPEKTVK